MPKEVKQMVQDFTPTHLTYIFPDRGIRTCSPLVHLTLRQCSLDVVLDTKPHLFHSHCGGKVQNGLKTTKYGHYLKGSVMSDSHGLWNERQTFNYLNLDLGPWTEKHVGVFFACVKIPDSYEHLLSRASDFIADSFKNLQRHGRHNSLVGLGLICEAKGHPLCCTDICNMDLP
jgi:hypothetical protein